MVLFIVLSAYNIGLIGLFLRIWGIASAEGLMMTLYGAMVISDNLELLYHYFFNPDMLSYGNYEILLRIHPTEVYILATLILMAGLFAGNPKRVPVAVALGEGELAALRDRGLAIAVVGGILFAVGIALTGRGLFAGMREFRYETSAPGKAWERGME